ncbi:MAG: 3-isopropylmalate dehydrogenase [Spirochaetales bacterium]|jgi:3-isopropylmalate dehydrogenase|nr:3-isopropylmalate dehydrogenase [Spirochaetales bacterium]
MNEKIIAVLAGDGIGPEVMAQALKALVRLKAKYRLALTIREADFGGAAIDRRGTALPPETLSLCQSAAAVLLGSVGGPSWEKLPPQEQPERAGLLTLRKTLGLFANLRPALVFPQLIGASPLKPEIISGGLDVLVVRELTGGIYFGQPKKREGDLALDTLVYTRPEIERIARVAFEAARRRNRKVCSVDKANVLESMVLWREVAGEIAKDYPDVELRHIYVDNAAMQLVRNPKQFDVLLCGNMFGDILSDEAAMITGSLGMLPSASLGAGNFGLYEPAGGSAPDIAGKNLANPLAQILCLAMLFRHSLEREDIYQEIYQAVNGVLDEGWRTRDIMSPGCRELGTEEMGDRVADKI